jgi:protein-disulfide isomerase
LKRILEGMTHRRPRRLSMLALLAAPLALAACGSGSDGAGSATSGEPLAKVAAPAGQAWGDVVAKTEEGGYRMGNPDAPIKLIEFGSLTCGHCADFSAASKAELTESFVNSGRVSFEFRNFVRDPMDLTAAQLTRCGAPESFFALTEQAFGNLNAMFEKVQAAGEQTYAAAMSAPDASRGQAIASLTGLDEFFAARGIAKDQAAQCLANSADARALAERTQKYSEEYAITGTPTFLINGNKVEGNTWLEIKTALEKAGAR